MGERITEEIQGIEGTPASVRSEPIETLAVLRRRHDDLSAVAAFDSHGAVLEDARVFRVGIV
jgi:hypothetical protein